MFWKEFWKDCWLVACGWGVDGKGAAEGAAPLCCRATFEGLRFLSRTFFSSCMITSTAMFKTPSLVCGFSAFDFPMGFRDIQTWNNDVRDNVKRGVCFGKILFWLGGRISLSLKNKVNVLWYRDMFNYWSNLEAGINFLDNKKPCFATKTCIHWLPFQAQLTRHWCLGFSFVPWNCLTHDVPSLSELGLQGSACRPFSVACLDPHHPGRKTCPQ